MGRGNLIEIGYKKNILKKINNLNTGFVAFSRGKKLAGFLILIFIFLYASCSEKFIKRDSLPRELAFTKLFVYPPVDSSGNLNEFSELAQETIIKEIKKMNKYKVVNFSSTRSYLEKFGLTGDQFIDRVKMFDIAERTGAEGVIYGEMTDDSLKLILYSTLSGEIFYSTSEDVPENFDSHSTRAISLLLLRRLLSFVPYDALVTKVSGNRVMINAGSRNGVVRGMKMTIFEIVAFRPGELRGEFKKIPIARVKGKKLAKKRALVKVLHRNSQYQLEKFNKVSFMDFYKKIELPFEKKKK